MAALALLGLAGLSAPARADELEDLRRRVTALEDRLAGRPATATAELGGKSESPAPGSAAAESAEKPAPKLLDRVRLGAWVDVYYAYNTNRPRNSSSQFTGNFIPNTGSTGKRANQVDLNVAAIDVVADPEPAGFHITASYGTGSQVVHAGEPQGDPTLSRADWWDVLYQATAAVKLPLGRGLLVEAGIMPSHIGFEGFYSKDNWSYTRGWLGENSPYYQCGLKLAYPLTDELSAAVFFLNGWQIIGDNNDSKAVGTQVAYSSELLSVSLNTFAGPELTDDNTHWRLFADLVAVVKPTKWLHLATQLDFGSQELPGTSPATWGGVGGFVHLMPADWLAFALRYEHFADPDNGISGVAQRLNEWTGTIELKPVDHLSVKLEARWDRSDEAVFAGRRTLDDGTGERWNEQTSFFVGMVVWF